MSGNYYNGRRDGGRGYAQYADASHSQHHNGRRRRHQGEMPRFQERNRHENPRRDHKRYRAQQDGAYRPAAEAGWSGSDHHGQMKRPRRDDGRWTRAGAGGGADADSFDRDFRDDGNQRSAYSSRRSEGGNAGRSYHQAESYRNAVEPDWSRAEQYQHQQPVERGRRGNGHRDDAQYPARRPYQDGEYSYRHSRRAEDMDANAGSAAYPGPEERHYEDYAARQRKEERWAYRQPSLPNMPVAQARAVEHGNVHKEERNAQPISARNGAVALSRPYDEASGSRPYDAASSSRPYDAASGSRHYDAASGSRPYEAALGSRAHDAASGSRPHDAASGSRSQNAAASARPMLYRSSSAPEMSTGSSRTAPPSQRPAARPAARPERPTAPKEEGLARSNERKRLDLLDVDRKLSIGATMLTAALSRATRLQELVHQYQQRLHAPRRQNPWTEAGNGLTSFRAWAQSPADQVKPASLKADDGR